MMQLETMSMCFLSKTSITSHRSHVSLLLKHVLQKRVVLSKSTFVYVIFSKHLCKTMSNEKKNCTKDFRIEITLKITDTETQSLRLTYINFKRRILRLWL